jgi:CHAT domain-containing protein/tetratricopeptide (TPR) repeat protein
MTKLRVTVNNIELKDFDGTSQRLLRYAIAAFLDISPDDVRIASVERGSVKVTIELPTESIEKLKNAHQRNDPELAELLAPLVLVELRPEAMEAPASSLESLIEQIRGLPRIPKVLNQRIVLCRQALEQVGRESRPILWAQLHVELGLCLHQTSDIGRPRHLEEAIGHFQAALNVYTRTDHAEVWAATLHNLAAIYAERVQGDKAANLEQAICLYEQALDVRTQDSFPEDWANTQRNLANAYTQRITGNRAKNLDRAISLYRNALSVWTPERYPLGWAQAQKDLGMAYLLRVQGVRSNNLQTAIACFEKALTFWTRQAHPLDWAEVQDRLGLVWRHYTGDNPATNVERAVECHQAALQVWTRENHPWEWARAQHNLGTAWRSRLRGNHAGDLEKAIQCYQQALTVRTRDTHPEAWAETTHNLATAYSECFTSESLERAIGLYNQVLQVRTRQDLPLAWARTQSELANAYARRIRGERATNLEQAIVHYKQALKVQSPETCPQDWAMTQQNLAVAYSERLVEDKADSLRRAVRHYKQSLRVFDRHSSLMRWATVQTDLADTCWKLGNLEHSARYLDQAVSLCLEVVDALDLLPRSPIWALAHYNLGNAFGDRSRIRGVSEGDQEQAIRHYAEALKFYTPQAFPERWANTHNNLAVTYGERQQGDRAENLARAIRHFDIALEVATPESFPVDARRAARNLGNLLFGEGRWAEAHTAYTTSLKAAKTLYTAAFMEAGREAEITENASLYAHDAFCLAHLGRLEEALIRLEEGKTRTLAERLGRDAVQLEKAGQEDKKAYDDLVRHLRNLEAEQRAGEDGLSPGGARRSYTEIAGEVERTRQDLKALVQRIQGYLEDFLPGPLDFAAMQALVTDERTALVEFCVTEKGSVIFLVRQEGRPEAVWVEGFTRADLLHLLLETPAQVQSWLERYRARVEHPAWWKAALSEIVASQGRYQVGWQVAYQLRQVMPKKHPARASAWLAWLATIERVMTKVGLGLIAPLHAELQQHDVTRLILVPQGGLFLLPLHAASLDQNGACLLDRYEVSYAPSATVSQRCRERAAHARTQGLFAVANPTLDLDYSETEIHTIESLFGKHSVILWRENATKMTTLAQASGYGYTHFSCHGQYNWDTPTLSALFLAGSLVKGKGGGRTIDYEHALTLTEVEAELDLAQTRLVTLSACETGLSEALGPRAEEYVGLPAGFLLAGAPAVVASLWAVNDLSTALLIRHFYLCHLQGDPDRPDDGPLSPASALRRAQRWLRDVTAGELAAHFGAESLKPTYLSQRQALALLMHFDQKYDLDSRPFGHPTFWAPFTISGQ